MLTQLGVARSELLDPPRDISEQGHMSAVLVDDSEGDDLRDEDPPASG